MEDKILYLFVISQGQGEMIADSVWDWDTELFSNLLAHHKKASDRGEYNFGIRELVVKSVKPVTYNFV